MNFNNITTLATGLAAWAVEMAGQEETPAYLVGTLALGAIAAFGVYVYGYNRGPLELDFFRRHLEIAPDLSPYPQLRRLDLRLNRLTIAPDLSHTPRLLNLYLSSNQLTVTPDLSHTPQLQSLTLNRNQLTTAPDLSYTPRLRNLHLTNNQLTVSPDVSHTPRLEILLLSNNQLTELHDSILFLSSDCEVYAEDNRFSAEYVAEFQERLRQHRLAHPGQGPRVFMSIRDDIALAAPLSLEEELAVWAQEFEIAFPEAGNPELWAERCRQLQLHAERQAALHQLGDEVETVLYYRVYLRDALDLPISTRNMLYPGVSGVSQEMLNAARAEIAALTDDQLLATSPHWQARMVQLHQNRVNDITNQYTGFLNDLGDYFDLESTGAQEQYLEERDDLAELIGRTISLDIVGYPAMSGFIDLERQRVISELI